MGNCFVALGCREPGHKLTTWDAGILSSFIWLIGGLLYVSYEYLAVNPYDERKHIFAWQSAFVFMVATCGISFSHIGETLNTFYRPKLQTYVVRILLMVPIYSIESWLALRKGLDGQWTIILETAREMYEAYVIYCFMCFLMEYLGRNETEICYVISDVENHHFHHVPNWVKCNGNCCDDWIDRWEFLVKCRRGALQCRFQGRLRHSDFYTRFVR